MILSALFLLATGVRAPAPAHTFTRSEGEFLLDGKPARLVSGEMHYARIPREYWRDRFRRARAMGINAVSTYVFWDLQEPTPNKFDFSGQEDIAEFVREAAQEGLWVILRPGPYVCAEWDWGGFPWWLARIPGMQIRQNNAPFLNRVEKYFKALGQQLAPLTIAHGGPILMCQVENEYGSFGDDKAYTAGIKDLLVKSGFDCMLYTADGSADYMLKNGTLPDTTVAINFGGGAKDEFANLEKFGYKGPKLNGEYWCGWFDHWNEAHHTSSVEDTVAETRWMITHRASMSFYMLHGGTNFGWMAGANSGGKGYEPTITSYDYDAPIAEDGTLTPKYFALRNEISKYTGENNPLPEPPEPIPHIVVPSFELTPWVPLTRLLDDRQRAEIPLSFETLGQDYGYVLYRSRLPDGGTGPLKLENLQDRAIIFVDGKRVGTLERRLGQTTLDIAGKRNSTVEILVENLGRVNFSRTLLNERKGFSAATLGDLPITDWQMYKICLDMPWRSARESGMRRDEPTIFRGSFKVDKVGDTYLDMTGWGHGNVWVNGHALGRYWSIGPQQALYTPGVWLHKGVNEVTVLDTDPTGKHTLRGVLHPIWSN